MSECIVREVREFVGDFRFFTIYDKRHSGLLRLKKEVKIDGEYGTCFILSVHCSSLRAN